MVPEFRGHLINPLRSDLQSHEHNCLKSNFSLKLSSFGIKDILGIFAVHVAAVGTFDER